MFSQVAQAIRQPSGAAPLGPLRARRILATGESQSAFRLVTYVDAIHPSPTSTTASSSTAAAPAARRCRSRRRRRSPRPPTAFIRDRRRRAGAHLRDRDRPHHARLLPRPPARRPARAALGGRRHVARRRVRARRRARRSGTRRPRHHVPAAGDVDLRRHHVRPADQRRPAALRTERGALAPQSLGPHGPGAGASAPRLDIDPGPPPPCAHDPIGNVLGGIRTPQVDVPIATLSGLGQSGAGSATSSAPPRRSTPRRWPRCIRATRDTSRRSRTPRARRCTRVSCSRPIVPRSSRRPRRRPSASSA